MERLETGAHLERFGASARTGRADADSRQHAAVGLLIGGFIGGVGAGLVRKRPVIAAPLLALGAVTPAFGALWALCPAAFLGLAALAALAGRHEDPPAEAPAYEPPSW